MWNIKEMSEILIESEVRDGIFINLGIGMPTEILNYIPKNIHPMFQSENGILGMGEFPKKGEEDPDLINAGKQTVTIEEYGSFFDSANSFAMIRGGHIDLSILGAFEVSENADIANWSIPNKMIKGMGGAMDLVSSAKRVVVVMDHVSKNGDAKLVKKCSLPLTGVSVVNKVVTNYGVFEFIEGKLILIKKAHNVSLELIKERTDAKFEVNL